jgi:ribosomal-protein-alanine N-acetyltransferase
MAPVAIRAVQDGELPVLSALHARSFADGWSGQTLQGLLQSPGVFALAAEAGPVFLGFILVRVAADEAEILTLAVAPERRRQGAGHALLAAAAAQAAGCGADRMILEVASSNAPARALYRRLGFRQTGLRKAYYRPFAGAPAEDALILAAPLPLGAQVLGKSGELD